MEEKSIKKKDMVNGERIVNIEINDEMKKSFIAYAMAVNASRAIPDVRDGLKPVHRRILYALHELGFTNDKPHRKCARIVGEVLGKFHPHGDSSVYDALVRLAQPFSINEPLIDGHGNFGSMDGDGAAAMRYTEARMSKIANEMLKDLEKNTVDFYPNFDDTLQQPTVLTSRYPNVLVNGADGIAVGMATSIPPHNLSETIDAVCAYIDDEEISIEELIKILPGPDFPTGGIILGREGIVKAYKTGRGITKLRARIEMEKFNNNTRDRIVIKELPYQANKETLVANIKDKVIKGVIDGISKVEDQSDREGVRVVIEIKKDKDRDYILNQLYKYTSMQISVSMALLVLVNGTPRTLGLKEIIKEYVAHQREVIERRTKYDLEKALEKAHILEGLVIALNDIDRVIQIIKASKDNQEASRNLMSEFELTDRQTFAILDMKLRRLTSLEIEKIINELEEIRKFIDHCRLILSDFDLLNSILKEEMLEIKRKYGTARKSDIENDYSEINLEDLIEKEEVVITLSEDGYIKRLSLSEYKEQNRGGRGVIGQKTKEEDLVSNIIVCNTHSNLLFFTSKGRVYKMKAYNIPEGSKTSRGRAMVNVITFEQNEKLSSIVPYDEQSDGYVVICTKFGTIKKTSVTEYEKVQVNGKIAIGLKEEDEIINAAFTTGSDEILIGTKEGYILRTDETNIRAMGRTAQGVRGITLRSEEDIVIAMEVAREGKDVLTVSENGIGKITPVSLYRKTNRGGKGVRAANFDNKTGGLATFKMVSQDDGAMLVTDKGVIIRIELEQVRVCGKNSKGVILKRVDEDERIAAVTIIPYNEEEEIIENID